jgi:hypothetical protein
MLELLSKYGFVVPELKSWSNKNAKVWNNEENTTILSVDDMEWMGYSSVDSFQSAELFSHHYLAKGHCVCTGMGLGIRENWLMNKKEVTKITIIEKNEQVLEYHKYNKSPFLKECEVLISDASDLNGKCDTLLLDHYEDESYKDIIKNVKKISNNVDCETLWFWPLERLITDYKNYKNNNFNLLDDGYQSYPEIYEKIKVKNGLSKLPDLDDETLRLFCFLFSYKNFR